MTSGSNPDIRFAPPPPPPPPPEENYYVYNITGSSGPLPRSAIESMIANGDIVKTTHIVKVGDSQWIAAGEHALFSSIFDAPPGSRRAGASSHDYAGFGVRLGAYLIDAVIVILLAAVAGVLTGVVLVILNGGRTLSSSLVESAGQIVGLAVGISYYGFFFSGKWQATPGKRLLGLYVIREDEQKIGFGLAVGRYLSYILSSIILGIGFLMIIWTDQHKGLHDMICKTRVVRGKL